MPEPENLSETAVTSPALAPVQRSLPSSARSRPALLARLRKHGWALTGLGMALLVLLVLPSAQIKLGAAQLQGLVGSYTSPHYDVAYSGGITTLNTNPPTNDSTYTLTSAPGAWGGGGNAYGQGYASASCTGQITAAFTWNPGPGNTPPRRPGQ